MKSSFQQWLSPNHNRGIGLVLTVCGAMGFLLGFFVLPDWQVAVETTQVVAGIVPYPKDNPFYMYHVKLWTILHQLLALFLKAGVSEQTASLWISGFLGMVTFQAFGTVILALSGDWLLAIGGTIAIFFARPNEVGVIYPLSFMGSEHTYGILGLSYLLLVIGLLGGGWRRSGAFLLGLAPAVHPSLGFWLGVIVAGCCLLDIRRFRENWLPWLKFFFIGGAVTTISLIIQMTLIDDSAKSVPIDGANYFNAFVSFWDLHRAPVNPRHPGVTFNTWALVLSIVSLVLCRKDFPSNSALIVRAIVVGAALALGAVWLSSISPDKLPRTLVMLMPARLLNVPILASLPVLIGVVGMYRKNAWGQALMLALLLGLIVGGAILDGQLIPYSSHLWMFLVSKGASTAVLPRFMVNPWHSMIVISIATMLAVAVSQWKSKRSPAPAAKQPKNSEPRSKTAPLKPVTIWLRRACWVVLSLFLILTFLMALPLGKIRRERFHQMAGGSVLAEVARGKGMLLTGGDLHLIQLRTRRPVLLDGGGLDGIAYILPAAPAMDQILKEVYQIDIFNPPEEARHGGVVPTETNKMAWENMSIVHWVEIGRKYGITDVLTYADWELDVPQVARDDTHALYRIPSP